VKKHGLETSGFFNWFSHNHNKHFRIHCSMVRKILVAVDSIRWFLILLAFHFFFVYVLGLPAVLFGLYYGGTPVYLWYGMWVCVFIMLAIREDIRHNKATSGNFKWVDNVKATKEWVEWNKDK